MLHSSRAILALNGALMIILGGAPYFFQFIKRYIQRVFCSRLFIPPHKVFNVKRTFGSTRRATSTAVALGALSIWPAASLSGVLEEEEE